MSVRIQLDHAKPYYTTYDTISGRVIVNFKSSTSVDEIIVKLEAESKTRLDNERGQYNHLQPDKRLPQTVELEFHKVMYEVASVFPGSLGQGAKKSGGYTLRSGQHEYAFSFKIPFLNSCFSVNSFKNNLNLQNNRVEMAKNTDRHVRNPLPPTVGSFPQMAEIRYFVKVTVKRPMFFQENIRNEHEFNFLPIEPPRPPLSDKEVFVRRKHIIPIIHQPLQKKKSFFGKMKPPKAPTQNEEVRLSVDARLPHPGILTCHKALPLRVIAKKMSPHAQQVVLRSLQIRLIGTTQMRAHDLHGSQRQFWVVVSQTELQIPIGNPNDPVDAEWEVPNRLWTHVSLPDSVVPSFETCNVAMTYQLEIIVGLSASVDSGSLASPPQQIPVSMPVEVYSGVEAPPELLRRLREGASASPADEKHHGSTTDGNMMNHFTGNSSSFVHNGPIPAPANPQVHVPIPVSVQAPAYAQAPDQKNVPAPIPPAGGAEDTDMPPPSYDAVITDTVNGVQHGSSGGAGPSNGYQSTAPGPAASSSSTTTTTTTAAHAGPSGRSNTAAPANGGPTWPGAWPGDQKR